MKTMNGTFPTTKTSDLPLSSFYKFVGVSALLALSANVLDVVLGFGETDIVVYGSRSATEWFGVFHQNWFKGIYALGIFNMVYMVCMIPVNFSVIALHHGRHRILAASATIVFLVAISIYISNSAALLMLVLSGKHATAATEVQRSVFVAAGEAVLARGEDFTPGAFPGLILSGIAAIALSCVMLEGSVFRKRTAWIGIVAFSFLSVFTIWATSISPLYSFAYYFFGMIGGVLALAWFILVALHLFKESRVRPALT
jgi:hypothetical protein